MREQIEEVFEDFGNGDRGAERGRRGGSVTVWVKADEKERYERLQKLTNQDFSKRLYHVFLLAMDEAERRLEVS